MICKFFFRSIGTVLDAEFERDLSFTLLMAAVYISLSYVHSSDFIMEKKVKQRVC